MALAFQAAKRFLVGGPVQSERLGHTLLPKKIALPVFTSDALSSVAYATQEILLVLAAGGLATSAARPRLRFSWLSPRSSTLPASPVARPSSKILMRS